MNLREKGQTRYLETSARLERKKCKKYHMLRVENTLETLQIQNPKWHETLTPLTRLNVCAFIIELYSVFLLVKSVYRYQKLAFLGCFQFNVEAYVTLTPQERYLSIKLTCVPQILLNCSQTATKASQNPPPADENKEKRKW